MKDLFGVEFSEDMTQLVRCPEELQGEYSIPDGVKEIAPSAFEFCEELTHVVIPDSVTCIGESAFFGCDSLTSLEIPDSVTSIGDNAFSLCSDIESIVIPESIKIINKGTFARCYKLTDITFGSGVTHIGECAFTECFKLSDVRIPSNVKCIGEGAFKNCDHLVNVTICHGVTRIEKEAFEGCDFVTEIVIPKSVTYLAPTAFLRCGIKSFGLEENNPNYYTYKGVLFSKDKSKLIAYPSGKNGRYKVPDFVTSIGHAAFAYCKKLSSVEIGKNVTDIKDNSFVGCRLTAIRVSQDNPNYRTENGVLFNKDGSILIAYLGGKNYSIPDFVVHIGNNAFASSGLKRISISKNVTSIGRGSFYYCLFTDVFIPNGVLNIDDYAFYDSELQLVEISDSVRSIGKGAFECPLLSNLIIGSNVTKIGRRGFMSPALSSIVCRASIPPSCGNEVFHPWIKKGCKLYVPSDSVELYKTARTWRNFKNILPIDEKL